MPFGIGAPELLIVLAIVVVLFGATRLTDIGKNLGRGIKEFRRELKDDDADAKKTDATTAASTSSPEEKTPQAH
jgi:sec-independent protein translocase protein TatA